MVYEKVNDWFMGKLDNAIEQQLSQKQNVEDTDRISTKYCFRVI